MSTHSCMSSPCPICNPPRCFVLVLDGTPCRVYGDPLKTTKRGMEAMSEMVRAAKRFCKQRTEDTDE